MKNFFECLNEILLVGLIIILIVSFEIPSMLITSPVVSVIDDEQLIEKQLQQQKNIELFVNLIVWVCIINFIVFFISFLISRFMKNKEKSSDNEKMIIESKIKVIQTIDYISVIISSIFVGLMSFLIHERGIAILVIEIPSVLFIISAIFRLNKKTIVSNIICGITIFIILLSMIGSSIYMNIEENNKFEKSYEFEKEYKPVTYNK